MTKHEIASLVIKLIAAYFIVSVLISVIGDCEAVFSTWNVKEIAERSIKYLMPSVFWAAVKVALCVFIIGRSDRAAKFMYQQP